MYVQLSPVPANVSLARERVTRFGRAMGVSSSRLDDVAVAVSEAVTNAFTAHRDANSTETVELMAAIEDGGTLTVTVIDQGPGFVAPLRAKPPVQHRTHLMKSATAWASR